MDSDLAEHMIPYQVPRLARICYGHPSIPRYRRVGILPFKSCHAYNLLPKSCMPYWYGGHQGRHYCTGLNQSSQIEIVGNHQREGGEQTNHNRQTARSTTQMTWILNLVSINVDQLLTRNQSLCKAWQMTNGVTLSACTVRLQVHSMTKTKSTKFLKP